MNLEDLFIYNQSMAIADRIWEIVMTWGSFAKFTLGKQWVNSSDSIAQNISEGFGRFHYRDAKNFYYYARGSLMESHTILSKAHNRKLISDKDYFDLQSEHKDLTVRLNNYIKTVGAN